MVYYLVIMALFVGNSEYNGPHQNYKWLNLKEIKWLDLYKFQSILVFIFH